MQNMTSNWEVSALVRQWQRDGERIGFVPTMGNLHDGHLRLVKAAQQNTDRVVVSIYVNPMQFGPQEDLTNYPRTLEKDMLKLANVNVDLVFNPNDETMYPEGRAACSYVEVPPQLTEGLEGAHRQHHFRGGDRSIGRPGFVFQPW